VGSDAPRRNGWQRSVTPLRITDLDADADADAARSAAAADLSPGIRAIASWNLPPLDRRGGRPMKHKRFSDEQVIGVLKEHEAGAKVDDICRRHAISTATFYTWRKKYGGMEASDAKRLRELEAENTKLKRIVADQVLDMSAMKELLGKHW
jgi:putative transposase